MTKSFGKDPDDREWLNFLDADSISPPASVTARLHSIVARDLNPGLGSILLKVSAVHLGSAVASLAVCPQFGIGPFGGDAGLMALLMPYGWAACAAGCGAAFMMGTGILTALGLTRDERRKLSRHSGSVFSGLSALSWAAFMTLMSGTSDFGHSHSMSPEPLIPQNFSTLWSAVWALAAACSAWASYRVAMVLRPTGITSDQAADILG